MNKVIQLICLFTAMFCLTLIPVQTEKVQAKSVIPIEGSPDLEIRSANVRYLKDLDLVMFEQEVDGKIGNTLPSPVGQLDRAPVLGYVFPTTLSSEDVGFNSTEGIVALAVTSHPDFDDTPLWDENNDGKYDNDGIIFHTHWVLLAPDQRVPGGLSVKEFKKEDKSIVLPPTNPGMSMYMDSPGFSVMTQQETLKVLVPVQRINGKTNFKYDAVTAYMEVNTSDTNRPLLGVYKVYSVRSGDLSLPYSTVQE